MFVCLSVCPSLFITFLKTRAHVPQTWWVDVTVSETPSLCFVRSQRSRSGQISNFSIELKFGESDPEDRRKV